MKKTVKKSMNKLALAVIALALGSCVTPYLGDVVKMLKAAPRRNLYPLFYNFDPEKELDISAVNNWGDVRGLKAEETTVRLDDFVTVGEKTGTVEYQGCTARFSYYVYDPNQPGGGIGVSPGGPSIIIETN